MEMGFTKRCSLRTRSSDATVAAKACSQLTQLHGAQIKQVEDSLLVW